jgi:hemerythrin-like domain-containing protein
MNKTKPLSFLGYEHMLIEEALALFEDILAAPTIPIESVFALVDFFRTYADRCHHGKEEDILFTLALKKDLKEKDKKLLEELMWEHKKGRSLVSLIYDANLFFQQGNSSLVEPFKKNIKELVSLYFEHIQKENAIFFPAVLTYFSKVELEEMYDSFEAFDRSMIHEKYQKIIQTTKISLQKREKN